MNEQGHCGKPVRIAHDRERMRALLEAMPPASTIARETTGSYDWLVDEMETGRPPGAVGACTDVDLAT